MVDADRQLLAANIARDLFELGSDPNDVAQRIEFKGGEYPDKETGLGGLSEYALTVFLARALEKHGV